MSGCFHHRPRRSPHFFRHARKVSRRPGGLRAHSMPQSSRCSTTRRAHKRNRPGCVVRGSQCDCVGDHLLRGPRRRSGEAAAGGRLCFNPPYGRHAPKFVQRFATLFAAGAVQQAVWRPTTCDEMFRRPISSGCLPESSLKFSGIAWQRDRRGRRGCGAVHKRLFRSGGGFAASSRRSDGKWRWPAAPARLQPLIRPDPPVTHGADYGI